MKKWIVIVFGVLLLSIVCIYVLIPGTVLIERVEPVKCNATSAFTFFNSEQKWTKWWPGQEGVSGGYRFRLQSLYYLNVDIKISGEEMDVSSRMSVIPVRNDSILLQWTCRVPTSPNPVQRVLRYRAAKRLSGSMQDILTGAGAFLGKQENVYGVAFREGSTSDTYLVALRKNFTDYPSTREIYDMIGIMQAYIKESGARQTSYPIMNVDRPDSSGKWRMTVAVPTDRALEKKGDIYFMRLIPAKFLIADVKGGEMTVMNGVEGMNNYIRDYRRTVMAMPYRALITDRMAEPDTSRWETRLYCPIF